MIIESSDLKIEKSVYTGSVRVATNQYFIGRIDRDGAYFDKPFEIIGIDLL